VIALVLVREANAVCKLSVCLDLSLRITQPVLATSKVRTFIQDKKGDRDISSKGKRNKHRTRPETTQR